MAGCKFTLPFVGAMDSTEFERRHIGPWKADEHRNPHANELWLQREQSVGINHSHSAQIWRLRH